MFIHNVGPYNSDFTNCHLHKEAKLWLDGVFKSWARANRKILEMPTLLSKYVLGNLKLKSY